MTLTHQSYRLQTEIYDAEQIVRRRVYRRKPEYLIKWRGYSKRYNTFMSHRTTFWMNAF